MKNYKKMGIAIVATFMLMFTKVVNAESLTINDIATKFNSSLEVLGLKFVASTNIKAQDNSSSHTLDVYNGENKIASFPYDDSHLEFTNNNVTKDNYDSQVLNPIIIYILTGAVLDLSEAENGISLKNFSNTVNDYDTYGFYLELDSLNTSANMNVNGQVSPYVKSFKISLDKEKIKTLIKKVKDTQSEEPMFSSILAVTLGTEEVTENSIKLKVSMPEIYATAFSVLSANDKCNIYRSNSADGTYEKITTEDLDCTKANTFEDKNLNKNVTYYYKVQIDGKKNYSDTLVVTTSNTVRASVPVSSNSESGSKEEIKENPDTGSTIPYIAGSILVIGSIALIVYANKKNHFKQI